MESTIEYSQLIWILGIIGVLGGVFYSSVIERHWLDVRRVRIPLAELPRSFSGFQIALLSDAHLGFFYSTKQLSAVVDMLNKLGPDVICFTGDFLDSDTSLRTLEPAIPVLSRLRAPFGKFAVLGNHDYRAGVEHVIRGLEHGGFRVLKNQHSVLEKDDDRLFITGLDDVLKGKPNLEKALEGIPEAACNILLVHEPDYADVTKKFPIALQLSGHSHGGQVCLPFVGPILTTKLGKKYHSGLKELENVTVYTSRGMGTTFLPIRFFCRPEITMITLERSDS